MSSLLLYASCTIFHPSVHLFHCISIIYQSIHFVFSASYSMCIFPCVSSIPPTFHLSIQFSTPSSSIHLFFFPHRFQSFTASHIMVTHPLSLSLVPLLHPWLYNWTLSCNQTAPWWIGAILVEGCEGPAIMEVGGWERGGGRRLLARSRLVMLCSLLPPNGSLLQH